MIFFAFEGIWVVGSMYLQYSTFSVYFVGVLTAIYKQNIVSRSIAFAITKDKMACTHPHPHRDRSHQLRWPLLVCQLRWPLLVCLPFLCLRFADSYTLTMKKLQSRLRRPDTNAKSEFNASENEESNVNANENL